MMNVFAERRKHERTPYRSALEFTVLSMESSELQRMRSHGETVDKSQGGIGLVTSFPLEPGHVLQWDDKHHQGMLHMAIVKWSQSMGDHFRAGLMFI